MTHPATIVCIKWGTLFGPEYVNRLYSGVRRNMVRPIRFICMTDDAAGFHPDIEVLDLPVEPYAEPMNAALKVANRQGAMRKTSLFKPGLIANLQGPILGFDLDVVITGPLDDIYEMAPGQIAMRHDWTEKRKGRFRYDPEGHTFLYNDLAADPYTEVEKARGSEQRYTSHKAMDNDVFAYIPDNWVVSFKYDCNPFPRNYWRAPHLPKDARVVCFHGRPKMTDAIDGYTGSLIRYAKPCAWLQEHWIDRAKTDLGVNFA